MWQRDNLLMCAKRGRLNPCGIPRSHTNRANRRANGPKAGTRSPRVGLVRRAVVYRTGRAVGPLITAPHPRQFCRTYTGPRRI